MGYNKVVDTSKFVPNECVLCQNLAVMYHRIHLMINGLAKIENTVKPLYSRHRINNGHFSVVDNSRKKLNYSQTLITKPLHRGQFIVDTSVKQTPPLELFTRKVCIFLKK